MYLPSGYSVCLCVHTHIYIHTPNNFAPCRSLAPSVDSPPKFCLPLLNLQSTTYFKNNYSISCFKNNSSRAYQYYFWEDLFVKRALLPTGSETYLVYLFIQLLFFLNDISFSSISSKVLKLLFLWSPLVTFGHQLLPS